MKILHINLQKSWRGGEQQLAYLMTALHERKIDQILICSENSKLEGFAKKEKLQYVALKKGFFQKIINLNKLSKLISREKIDLIHCHESKGHSLALFTKIIYNFKAKILLHRRVVFPIKGFFSKKVKYSSKYIDLVICISNAVEKVFHETTGNKNTVIIHSMTDTHLKSLNQGILSTKYNIPENKTIIGYIAALTFEKDHFTFLDTAKLLLKENDLHFVLIGEGKEREQLVAYSNQLGLSEHVDFIGFVENAKQLIPEIDILLFTSTKEGLGSTILDFFVAKKPVVTVKNGGSEDLVFNGETGFICNPKDSETLAENIKFLINNPEKKDIIVENAYQFVENNFSIDSITEKTIDVYAKLINTD